MNIDQLKNSGMVMFDAVAGSHAYGTNIPESDVDYRGIFMHPDEEYLGLNTPVNQISDAKNDLTYYSLKRYFELTSKATPNTLELLWMPDDTVQYQSPAFKHLKANRNLFISKKCYYTFTGYAFAQIKKAKGQNKWVNNPQPKERPDKFDFCWYVDTNSLIDFDYLSRISCVSDYRKLRGSAVDDFIEKHGFPVRPRKFMGIEIDLLKSCHASKLEHSESIYRIYDYTDADGKGVFRGPNQQIVVESIPKRDEWTRFAGLLIFNQNAYERACTDHKHYWEWVKNRNTARWVTQEAGEIDYDAKNMLHCVRLIMTGKSILETGSPIVRFEGEALEYLMNIRKGMYEHEDIMAYCESELELLEELKTTSTIPDSVDQKKINTLYQEVREIAKQS